jgi:hypothetical protein
MGSKAQEKNQNSYAFLDNAPCHPNFTLEMIKLRFIPTNTTSHTQPLDQGIIKTFKCYYRRRVVKRIISYIDKDYLAYEVTQKFNIKDACIWLAEAWKEVKPSRIANCFRKAGFISSSDEVDPEVDDCSFVIFESIVINGEIKGVAVETNIDFDDNLETFDNIPDNFEEVMLQNLKSPMEMEIESEDDEKEIED